MTGQPVRVDEASDEEFDVFIRQYIQLGWTLEQRIDALIDVLEDGHKISFAEPEQPKDTAEKLG